MTRMARSIRSSFLTRDWLPQSTQISIRSAMSSGIDVVSWSGGGHRQAAGFNTPDDLEAVVQRVDDAIRSQLGLDG